MAAVSEETLQRVTEKLDSIKPFNSENAQYFSLSYLEFEFRVCASSAFEAAVKFGFSLHACELLVGDGEAISCICEEVNGVKLEYGVFLRSQGEKKIPVIVRSRCVFVDKGDGSETMFGG